MVNDKILKKENFLDESYIVNVLNFAKNTNLWETSKKDGDFWSTRTLGLYKVPDEIKTILKDVCIKTEKFISESYNLNKPVYIDTIDLVRWFPGQHQPAHCDDMTNDDTEKFKFSHRAFGSIIYLNDDYLGGETFYPNFEISVKPKKNTCIVHPGDCDHLHGVTKIENSIRYTIASFWTHDQAKQTII